MTAEEDFYDFDNDKDVIQWRKEREAFQQMIDDAAKWVCRAFQAEKSGHKNLKPFLVHRSVDTPFFATPTGENGITAGFTFVFSNTRPAFAQQGIAAAALIIILPV